MNERSIDPQRTIDSIEANPNPETLDLTGAYQPAPSTEPTFPSMPAESPSIPGYIITGEIAKGGMGRVLAGRELSLDREVAIKTLLPKANAERFLTESKITAKLPHPNIPPVYALGQLADGTPYLAMKLIRGQTLAALLGERETPAEGLSRFLQIFEQIAQAVGFAHAQGIIHRDLKPANVMVGAFGEVQVMDWGLARELRSAPASPGRESGESAANPELTRAGTIMGTPAYMAPEQARGEVVDARADVFALGAMLCEILIEERPWGSGLSAVLVARAARGDVSGCFALLDRGKVDGELQSLAKKCLASNADDRYPDAQAVAVAIAEFRAGVESRLRQAEAERAATVVRDFEQRKRWRVLAWSALAVLVVSVVGTSVSVWKADAANTAAKREAAQKVIADQKADAATQAEAATAAQLVKTQVAEAAANAETKKTQAALATANARTKSLGEAYGDFVFGIQNKLENRPGTQDLRRELLETARKGLGKILDDARKQGTPDNTLVWSHFRMGDVEVNLGNTLAAQKEYQAGNKLAMTLADSDPKNELTQADLYASYERLGNVTMQLGHTKEALAFYEKFQKISRTLADADPKNAEAQRVLGTSYNKLGDVTLKLGNTKDALAFFEKCEKICQTLIEADPKNAQAQRDLGAIHNRLGNVTLQLGNTQNALVFYEKFQKLCQTLADAGPKNAQAQRDLSVSCERLGNVTLRLGNTKDSVAYYEQSLKIRQTLADADPKNAQVQNDLSASYCRLGDVTLKLGGAKEALAFYEKSRKIRQTLADADPKNAEAQRVLGISYEMLGDVTLQLGNSKEALAYYEKSLKVSQTLADSDPKNAEAQRSLSTNYERLGNVTLRLGNTKDALAYYEKFQKICQTLVDADPKNAEAQRDLSASYERLGRLSLRLGNTSDAFAFYEKVVKVSLTLADSDPKNALAQRNLSVGYENLGDVTLQLGDTKDALAFYEKCQKICQIIADADPKNAEAQTDLFVSFYKLGSVEMTRHEYVKAAEWFDKGRTLLLPWHEKKLLVGQFKNAIKEMDREIVSCRNAEKAIADIEFAFKQDAVQVPILLAVRVKALLHRKQPDDAVSTAERFAAWAEKQEKGRDGQRYNASSAFAVCAAIEKDRDALVDKSLALLAKTKDGGYFDAKTIAELKQNRDFNGIRNHPKFVGFMKELEKPAEKK